ncbi:MAG TPA: diaminopimelate epimerase [Segetibacter sp.]
MKIQFYKYQGTGNDFIILDNREQAYAGITVKQVQRLCDRHFGIGADGLMLLNLLEGYDFEMKYYNADGHEASMCGNGGRCLVKFASDIGLRKNEYTFLAVDGPHHATFDEHGWVQLKMKDVSKVEEHLGNVRLDTGSPHYVKFITGIHHYNVFDEGRKIRYSKEFKDKGINVNFVEISDEEDKIYVRTYERGVENETLSCGTGVTASALVCAHNHQGFNRVEVQTPGGDLAVEFNKTGEQQFEDIWLCGPATRVFAGEIEV